MCSGASRPLPTQVAVNIYIDNRARLDRTAVIEEIGDAVKRGRPCVMEFVSSRAGVVDLLFEIEDAYPPHAVSVLVV